eukprot:9617555-Alexandrium_andersonii.AAC.1
MAASSWSSSSAPKAAAWVAASWAASAWAEAEPLGDLLFSPRSSFSLLWEACEASSVFASRWG